jgi:hypothetical protein
MATRLCRLVLPALLLTLSACRDAKIAVYNIPKETVPSAVGLAMGGARPELALDASKGGDAMAGTVVATAQGVELTWVASPHWRPMVGSAMRKGSFLIEGDYGAVADCAITAFPGDVGGDLANVNRWRAQLQLPPLRAEELPAVLETRQVGVLTVKVYETVGGPEADRQRVLGAIIPYDGATWFVKLSGPDALVAGERAAFHALLQTLRPSS